MFGTTPFNPPHATNVINDKWALYQAVEGHVLRPQTEAILKTDPRGDAEILEQLTGHVADSAHSLDFPFVLKPNSGSLSKNVFIANTPEEALSAISAIRKDPSCGDYLLAQQYLGDAHSAFPEIRAMCLDGECLIMYERTIDQADEANAAIWGGETIRGIDDPSIRAQVENLARHLHQIHDMSYIGLDLKVDRGGHIWLIEGNSSPMGLEKVRQQLPDGDALISGLTSRMLDKLQMHANSVEQTNALFDSIRGIEVT